MIKAAPTRLLGLVTCMAHPQVAADDCGLQAALDEAGVGSVGVAWNDPDVDWQDYDAVVLRSTWDYHTQHCAFERWLTQLEVAGVHVLNPVATLRWNADKHYLAQLAGMGAQVVPTQVVDGHGLAALMQQRAGESLVIKPTISGNSWHTVQGVAGSDDLDGKLQALPIALSYLVQPYLQEIQTQGEWSMIYFGGRFSHAVRKVPAAGDYRVQSDFGGRAFPAEPDVHVLRDAEQCLRAVARLGHGGHVYARVDGIVSEGRLQLMEVELIEPNLFLRSSDGAAARFAQAILASMDAKSSLARHRVRG